MNQNEFVHLGEKEPFCFRCDSEIPCFNDCCRDLNQFLSPYDILRLKTGLGLDSTRFLDQYVRIHIGPRTGLPVASLKPADPVFRKCPFVTPSGCRVYADRPGSCRMYPLVRVAARDRVSGTVRERYMLLQEEHCAGFDRGGHRMVDEWVRNQGLAPYNDFNDRMTDIISLNNQRASGPLSEYLKDMFVLCLYDVDRFRRLISEQPERYKTGDMMPAAGDDLEVLDFGFSLMTHLLSRA